MTARRGFGPFEGASDVGGPACCRSPALPWDACEQSDLHGVDVPSADGDLALAAAHANKGQLPLEDR